MNRVLLPALTALFIVSGCATAPVSHVKTSDSSTADIAAAQQEEGTGENSAGAAGTDEMLTEGNMPTPEPAALVGLTVEDAYTIAVANRPELAALQYRIAAGEGDAKQAGLWPNPVLTLGIEGYTPGGENPPPDLATLDNVATLSNRTRGRASTLYGILFPDVPNPVPTYEWWVPSIPDTRDPDQLQQVVSIAQPLPLWGTPRLARKAGLLEVERWRHEYERAKLELESEVQQ
ncbi:MAG: TolC family protein, partial [Candidatus Hydrogenedentes bacterium]|nr:TolC family protein [Candidatus Hydrogenedentota bacterium]